MTPIAVTVDNQAAFEALAWREIGLIENVGEFGKVFDRVVFQTVRTGRTYKFKGGYDDGALQLVFAEDLTAEGATSGMAIPAYFYPGVLWGEATSGSPDVTGYLVMNPDNGPGLSSDPAYVAAVNAAIAAGYRVLGYVFTSNAARLATNVKADIDAYKSWYNVSGIFLDETSGLLADVAYYQDLADYIRATAGTYVVLNPGAVPDETYMGIGDSVVVTESDYAAYLTWSPPSWAASYPGKTTHLIHGVAAANLDAVFALSQARHADNVYITDDALPNPWDTLPSYWSDEQALMRGGITGQIVLKDAAEAPNQENFGFRLVLADGKTFYFRGLCMSFRSALGSVNSVLKASATIEINGPIVFVG